MKVISVAAAISTMLVQAAFASDAENGRRIAESRCRGCHIIGMSTREILANSPPFVVIARKFSAAPNILMYEIRNPHAGMNLRISPREAEDIAAYINSLASR